MSQKYTILFDLDGTLVDSAPDLMLAHNHVMKKYGYAEKKLSDIKKLAGRGAQLMLARSIHDLAELSGKTKKTDDIVKEMTRDFIDYYSKNIVKESTLKTGVLDFLSWCKNNSISMAVCTNKQEHLSIDLLKKIKIYDFFDYVAGGNSFNHNKPDPRHLTDTIEVINGEIKKTIMIGDSETDSASAKAANIPFVLIKDGYTEKTAQQIYHDHLVKNFIGLDKIIQKYLDD
jgi:phosphoglycolate phosphatase|tara:strand:- start:385 stop:1074 length:690 start_codon:yes stop_codon:yes gene_type:complete